MERELTCGPEGFDLGRITAQGEYSSEWRRVHVHAGERSPVVCQLTSGLAAKPILIAVAASSEVLVEDVRLPDGTAVVHQRPHIRAWCSALGVGRRRPDVIWKDVPVSVVVEVEGYALLHFQWKGVKRGRSGLTMKPRGQ